MWTSSERNTLPCFDPDVLPCEAAGERKEGANGGHGERRPLDDGRQQCERQHAAACDGPAPEQARKGATTDRGDGQFMMTRCARREHVLEQDEREVHGDGG